MVSVILFAPLVGALISGLFGRTIGDRAAQIIPSALLILAAVLSWMVFYQVLGGADDVVTLVRWMHSGDLEVDWSLRVDTLTAVMLIVVTTVSAVVHVYSMGYMEEDPSKARFFSYLSLFTFAMLALVTANNFAQMFFGWEGVGLASYLLIGFWHHKSSANSAAMKAFIVNRVGDFGFALGIFGVFYVFNSLDFDVVFEGAKAIGHSGEHAGGHSDAATLNFLGMSLPMMDTLCVLLFIGAMGKSAQFFLHTWLPDAMEGPTPVSALIHAATMVTAGVFMVCRLSPMFEYAPFALGLVTVVGAVTAFFAATVGLVQNDIKRIIAYSTCSQLGYMFFAAGVGAYQASMFHLFTHAFFKALLFLGAGAVIHAMHHEQDIRKMGGLAKKIPITFVMMLLGTLAITGFPPLAGFFSKDMILESAWAAGYGDHGTFVAAMAFWMGLLVAALTSFYSWRLIFKVFFGPENGDPHTHAHAHESPLTMLIPIAILTIGAFTVGAVFYEVFVGGAEREFWRESIYVSSHNHVLHEAHYAPLWVKLSPFIMMASGLLIAWLLYIRHLGASDRLREEYAVPYRFLLDKWRFDELYDRIFVRPAMALGRFLWRKGDGATIDGAIDGLSMGVVPRVTALYQRAQSGYLFHYAFAMIIGVALLVALAMSAGGTH